MFYYIAIITCTLFGCETYTDYKVYKNPDQCIAGLTKFYGENMVPIGFPKSPDNAVPQSEADEFFNGGCIESPRKMTEKEIRVQIRLSFGPDRKIDT